MIQITGGTHFVAGWYQITGYSDTSNVTIDRNATDGSNATDGTGYVLAPCHNLQANTPVENILAMYDEAHRYGRF